MHKIKVTRPSAPPLEEPGVCGRREEVAIDGGDVGDRHSAATLQMPIRPPAPIF